MTLTNSAIEMDGLVVEDIRGASNNGGLELNYYFIDYDSDGAPDSWSLPSIEASDITVRAINKTNGLYIQGYRYCTVKAQQPASVQSTRTFPEQSC